MDKTTGHVIQLFMTHSIFRVVINYFMNALDALAKGKIKEEDIYTGFVDKFATEEFSKQTRINVESVNWKIVFDEINELNSPGYLGKLMLRGKLEERGIDPDNFNLAGWDLTISPNEEEEFNKSAGIG